MDLAGAALAVILVAGSTAGSCKCDTSDLVCRDDAVSSSVGQPYCIWSNYTKQDRPNILEDGHMYINTGFIIDDVSGVDDNSCAVTLVIIMRFSWTDDRIVINETAFRQKLRGEEKRLEIRYHGKSSLWIPDLYISNMRTLINTGFLDHPGVKLDISVDGTVYYARFAEVTFLCPMEFDSFPFDIHVCKFKVHSLESPDTTLQFRYEPDTRGVLWKTQTVLEHEVAFAVLDEDERKIKFKDLDGVVQEFSAIGVKVTLTRKYLPFIIDYYLPSGLFVIVSWVSFLVPPAIVPGRMALLVTLFLMLVNISTSAAAASPKSDSINALQVWLLCCIMMVFMALLEYAVILYMKNMRGVQRKVLRRSAVVAITPTKLPADVECWTNQQTEQLEDRIKTLDFSCVVLFPLIFATFNVIYWSLQYSTSVIERNMIE